MPAIRAGRGSRVSTLTGSKNSTADARKGTKRNQLDIKKEIVVTGPRAYEFVDGASDDALGFLKREEEKVKVEGAANNSKVIKLPEGVRAEVLLTPWKKVRVAVAKQRRARARLRKAAVRAAEKAWDVLKIKEEEGEGEGEEEEDDDDEDIEEDEDDSSETTAVNDVDENPAPAVQSDVYIKAEGSDDDVVLLTRPADKDSTVQMTTEVTREDIKASVRLLSNPKAKVKKDVGFDEVTVYSRISAIGWDFFDIPDVKPGMPKGYKTFVYDRRHIMNLYGGSNVPTEPPIAKAKRTIHGLQEDHWGFYNLDWNPHAPQHAGAPGLLVAGYGRQIKPFVRQMFVKLRPNQWLYVGLYKISWSTPLTATEFMMQTAKFKDLWATCQHTCKDSIPVVRTYLRIKHGREPTEAEMDEIWDSPAEYKEELKTVTKEQIVHAYESGEEELGVWTMKCISYDYEWQKFLIECYPKTRK